ncbi:PAAR-like domain-containing protein [Nannocystis bainbridge]|uniref:DUF4150 domain-containing protein n=1 Tax=Nannocystis bainbridge TaxID=2995303 RepID=A0ABT5E6K5_9BACT|nr:PAAR-like domain-containing protein [Nannocystis bainbridge]MDC0721496.1 DUF4150 domain-containing protein [Nannocystis bainbridge]
MTRTFANGRTIVHQRDGLVDVAGPPDVCKTPTPAGPAPVPYVNAARTADLAQGARRTRIGGGAIATAASFIVTSTGDEPGIAGGGVISSRIRGKLRWQSTSLDVRVEGKGVARFSDAVGHNGNTFNTAFVQAGGTGWAYGDDSFWPCPICFRGPASHRIHETADSQQYVQQLIVALRRAYDEYMERQPGVKTALDQAKAEEEQAKKEKDEFDARQKAASGSSQADPFVDPPGAAPGGSSSSQADPFADPPAAGANQEGRSDGSAAPTKAQLQAQRKARKAEEKKQKEERKKLDAKHKAAIEKIRNIGVANNKAAVHKNENSGYMVGVMICKCNQIFAAMSGETLPGFKAVVEQQGWTPCVEVPTIKTYADANPRIGALNRWTFVRRWNDAQRRNDRRQAFYNPPGKCAASKLVTHKDGHIPKAMTEMFFAPVPPHELRLRYRHYNDDAWDPWRVAQLHLSFGRSDPLGREQAFTDATTVPSCLSCQSMVPMTLCLHQKRTCPKGKQTQPPASTSDTQAESQPDPATAANTAGSSSTP